MVTADDRVEKWVLGVENLEISTLRVPTFWKV
jgi:hypothetical protein